MIAKRAVDEVFLLGVEGHVGRAEDLFPVVRP